MSGFVLREIPANEMAGAVGFDVPASFGEGWGAALKQTIVENAGSIAFRNLRDRQYYERTFVGDKFDRFTLAPEPSNVLTAEEANAHYGLEGHLAFDADTPEPVAASLRRQKDRELTLLDIRRRADAGIGTALTAGLLGSMLDPLNVGLAFVPVVGQTRYAAMVARMGAPGARAAKGAIEGGVGAALLEPIVYAGAQREQWEDYTAVDSLMNLVFGSALGAGLHMGAGYLGDRLKAREEASPLQRQIDDLPRQDQETLLRTAVAAIEEGRPVDVAPLFRAVAEGARPEQMPLRFGGETEPVRPAQQAAVAAEAREPTPMPLDKRVTEIESEIAELERYVPDGEREAINAASDAEIKTASLYEKAWKLAATCRMRRS